VSLHGGEEKNTLLSCSRKGGVQPLFLKTNSLHLNKEVNKIVSLAEGHIYTRVGEGERREITVFPLYLGGGD